MISDFLRMVVVGPVMYGLILGGIPALFWLILGRVVFPKFNASIQARVSYPKTKRRRSMM